MYTVGTVLEDLTRMDQVIWNETGDEVTDGPRTIKGLQTRIGDHMFTIRVVKIGQKKGSWLEKRLGCGRSVFYALVIDNVETGARVTYTDDPEVIPGKKDKGVLGIINVDPGLIAWHINGILFYDEKRSPESLKANLIECLDPELRQPSGGDPKDR